MRSIRVERARNPTGFRGREARAVDENGEKRSVCSGTDQHLYSNGRFHSTHHCVHRTLEKRVVLLGALRMGLRRRHVQMCWFGPWCGLSHGKLGWFVRHDSRCRRFWSTKLMTRSSARWWKRGGRDRHTCETSQPARDYLILTLRPLILSAEPFLTNRRLRV